MPEAHSVGQAPATFPAERSHVEVNGGRLRGAIQFEHTKPFKLDLPKLLGHVLFRDVFLDSPPTFHDRKDWKLKSVWVNDETTVAFFAGTAAGALGWGPKVPHEIEDSMKEAFRGIEKRNWKSCVVMCRRALQALMEVAYEKFLGVKQGKGLDLYGIIRSFEKLSPLPIRRHWLNIADAVRNIGNVPGAHPRPIPSYRFSKGDAMLAYSNTSSFVSAYFEKIAP